MKLVGKCFGFIGKDFEMIGRWVCRDTDGFHDGPTDHLPIINNRWARIFFEGVDATVFLMQGKLGGDSSGRLMDCSFGRCEFEYRWEHMS